jgi:hypothetical protein
MANEVNKIAKNVLKCEILILTVMEMTMLFWLLTLHTLTGIYIPVYVGVTT